MYPDGGCDSAVTARVRSAWIKVKELDRGRPKKTWWDSVKNDMESLGLSQKHAQSRNKWRIKGATGYPRFSWKNGG